MSVSEVHLLGANTLSTGKTLKRWTRQGIQICDYHNLNGNPSQVVIVFICLSLDLQSGSSYDLAPDSTRNSV